MGAAMGQVPEYTCMVTEWVKEVSTLPVIVKLTPNVTHIVPPGRAAQKGGADARLADQHDQLRDRRRYRFVCPVSECQRHGRSRRLLRHRR